MEVEHFLANKLLELNIIPDLVQLPYSILDRKFEESLEILKKLGCEFGQGYLFSRPLPAIAAEQAIANSIKAIALSPTS